jgi:hypothetical protein
MQIRPIGLIYLAVIGLLAYAGNAVADAVFEPVGATRAGFGWAISPVPWYSELHVDSSMHVSLAVGWQRYGLGRSVPRGFLARNQAIGFWRSTLYSSVGAVFESSVLSVPSPHAYIPNHWPHGVYGVGDYAWRSDPALRRYLLPGVDRHPSPGRVNLRQVDKPVHQYD